MLEMIWPNDTRREFYSVGWFGMMGCFTSLLGFDRYDVLGGETSGMK